MKSIRLLKKRLLEADVKFTNNVFEAIYLLPDGTMIDGEFNYGVRGQDHRIIEAGFKGVDRYDDKFWDVVHKDYKLVRLVPETGYALIRKRQRLTEEQRSILAQTNYDVEYY